MTLTEHGGGQVGRHLRKPLGNPVPDLTGRRGSRRNIQLDEIVAHEAVEAIERFNTRRSRCPAEQANFLERGTVLPGAALRSAWAASPQTARGKGHRPKNNRHK